MRKVELKGSVNRNDLFEIYKKSSVFLMTSRFEAFSLAALEAAWMGCYIVSTPVGGVSQLTNDWKLGRKINIEDANNLAKILIDICNNSDLLIKNINQRIEYVHREFNISRAMVDIRKALKI